MSNQDKTERKYQDLNNIQNDGLEDRLIRIEELLKPFFGSETNPLADVYDDYIQSKNSSTSISAKAGTGQRLTADGTGNQSITGIGFQPSALNFNACLVSNNGGFSIGNASSATDENCIYHYFDGTNWINNTYGYICQLKNGSGSTVAIGRIISFDSDGFTINWNILSENVYFTYKCIK